MAQISTAISDGVLALVAIRATMGLLSVNLFASLGFGVLASAACFGVARFSQSNPSSLIFSWHTYLSWLTAALGLPFIASGYFRQENISLMANLFLAVGIAMVVLRKILPSYTTVQEGANILAAVSMVAILGDSVWRFHVYTFLGAAIFIVAALVIGTVGFLYGFRRVDIFHYGLALSVIAFTIGFNTTQVPIFYAG